ncbi:unnamed protein product [Adineta steineri]|uniref:Uncharacterized protein n=1 Tax=Adineta steineri TaxID=433720 RepID=A0A819JKE4_9BILA|nr:unnamed protein product [Adineta steineri]
MANTEQETLISTFEESTSNNYSLIWFASGINTDEYNYTQEKLELYIDYFHIFNEPDSCQKYIQSVSTGTRIIFITNKHFGEQFISQIHQFRQISIIYIYCMNPEYQGNWTKQYKKIRSIEYHLDALIDRIKIDRTQRKAYDKDESLLMNIFQEDRNNEKSTMELNGEFIQTQLLIDYLDRMETTDRDKDELTILCKKIYRENKYQQTIIDEFQNTYSSDQAIRWYTRDSFLYRVLNKALRMQDTNILFLFRFFIRDITKQLRDHQYPSAITLYRGQIISKKELKLFEESNRKFVSITSFFSTTFDPTVALSYIDSELIDDDLQSVLFEIHADPSENQSKPFAETTSISYFPDEREVLMMLGSVFRIDSVEYLTETIKLIQMTLCNHNNQNLNLVFDYMRKKRGIGTVRLALFGRVLIGMAKFQSAENHFKCLLKTLPADHPDLPDCYQALGKIYCEKCDFDRSFQCFQTALDLLRRKSNDNSFRIAYIHNSIGELYQKKVNTSEALKSFQQALKIFHELLGDNNENVAWCYNNIGIVYFMEKKYPEALAYLKKALDLKKYLLPEKHPCLGNTYINLGDVYCEQGDYDLATKYYQESNEIFQTSLTPQHPSIARALRNIGFAKELKGDFVKASIFYNQALNLRQKILSPTHPDVLESTQDIQLKYDALQIGIIEINQNSKIKPEDAAIPMFDDRTSTTTVSEEQPAIEVQKRIIRSKRQTNDDDSQDEQEIKKPKLITTRSRSNASTDATYALIQQSDELNSKKKSKRTICNESTASTKTNTTTPIKPINKKQQDDTSDSKVKVKRTGVRGRPKKQIIESPEPTFVQEESHSPIYATIQQKVSLDRTSFATVTVNSSIVQIATSNDTVDTTPKPSTFERIQSFFRATPTLTSSKRANRVIQVKNTVVAFGSSTPTNRLPTSVVKTSGLTPQPIPAASIVEKNSTPESK